MSFVSLRYVLPTLAILVATTLNPLCASSAWGNQVQTRSNEKIATIKAQAEQLEEEFGEDISRLATWGGFEEALLYAIILVESEGNPHALSKRGARGLGQLMPITEKEAGCERAHEPAGNLACMTVYLTILWDRRGFKNKRKLLLAYFLGPNGARELLRENPKAIRTHHYITRVLEVERVILGPDLVS